jgi:hypothetical protein
MNVLYGLIIFDFLHFTECAKTVHFVDVCWFVHHYTKNIDAELEAH